MPDKKQVEADNVRVLVRVTIPEIDSSAIQDLRRALLTIVNALPGADLELTQSKPLVR